MLGCSSVSALLASRRNRCSKVEFRASVRVSTLSATSLPGLDVHGTKDRAHPAGSQSGGRRDSSRSAGRTPVRCSARLNEVDSSIATSPRVGLRKAGHCQEHSVESVNSDRNNATSERTERPSTRECMRGSRICQIVHARDAWSSIMPDVAREWQDGLASPILESASLIRLAPRHLHCTSTK